MSGKFSLSSFKMNPDGTPSGHVTVDMVDIDRNALKNPKDYAPISYFENMVSQMLKAIASTPHGTMEYLVNWMSGKETEVRKDANKSVQLRQNGNKLYAKSKNLNDFIEVLTIYNESIAFAPNNSKELALSYANRAIVFFHLNYFKESLADINRALCLPYPDNLMGKMLFKKVRCMKILNHPDVSIIYNDCLKWIDEHSINPDESKKELELANRDEVPECLTLIDIQFRDDFLHQMKDMNPTLEKVQFGKDSNGDMTLVTAKDISVGEVVAVQKVFTQIFHIDKDYLACCQCAMLCLNPIPCHGCATETYCSESCKSEAWSKYHETECKIVFLNKTLSNDYLLAIKICITAARQLGGILPLMKEVYKMSKSKDMNKEHRVVDGVYPADSYRNVYFMLNNRVIPQDMNHCDHVTKISVYIYFLATRTTFFNEKFRGGIHSVMQERMPKFLASLILRHFILINQVHSTTSITPLDFLIGTTAVCPLYHNLNNSCNPNSVKITYKDHQIIVAIDNIKKGEAINFSYFPTPLVTETKDKREMMKAKYLKTPCKCDLCMKQIPKKLIPLHSLNKNQYNVNDLAMIHEKLLKAESAFLKPYPKTAAEYIGKTAELTEIYKEFFARAPPFCKELIDAKIFLMNECTQIDVRKYRFIIDALHTGLASFNMKSMAKNFNNIKFK